MMFVGALLCFIVLVTGSEKVKAFIGQAENEQHADILECDSTCAVHAIPQLAQSAHNTCR